MSLTRALKAELDVQTGAAFADAHVASGRHGTDLRDGGDTWIGCMAWGGPSNPHEVDYAI